ncbi:MAG: DNA polymerase III subunit delta [Oscillospiraceae bacterium]|jgi:DNA polymerase-3 subunit delta|nr:DNA polymerase III subunit delta [Oscillospiraceae bacterium]
MAKKQPETKEYEALRAELAAGTLGRCYVLYGEERYLLERSLEAMRLIILPGGDNGFDSRRFSGAPAPDELRSAVDTYPLLSERTLVEVTDYDFSSGLDALLPVLRELPEHVCLLFVCAPGGFRADKRTTAVKELFKLASVVEFGAQDAAAVTSWIRSRFSDAGLTISDADAEYLAFAAGGYMAPLVSEIDKLAAHCEGTVIRRADIDALVERAPDAVSYSLTDALISRDFKTAANVLGELFAMREPPQKISYALTARMRALLLARLYIDRGLGVRDLMAAAGIRYEFQAKKVMAAARGATLESCREAVGLCCAAAFRLNDGGGQETLSELLTLFAARRLP